MAFSKSKRGEKLASASPLPEPLMHVAGRANNALRRFDSDLRASGFDATARGLARDLYVSFIATARAVKGTEDEAMAWAIIRALAVDLYGAGCQQGALRLLDGLLAVAVTQAPSAILQRLRATSVAFSGQGSSRGSRPKQEPAAEAPDI